MKARRFFLMCLSILSILTQSVQAQSLYRLGGTVTDTDGNALQGVSVLVSAITDNDTIVSGCITDVDGRYETLFEPTDTIRIRASLLGYRTRETVLAVKGETMTLDIALERSSVVLDEVSVEAEGAVLNAKGISYYPNDRQKKSAYDGTSLEARGADYFRDLEQTMQEAELRKRLRLRTYF